MSDTVSSQYMGLPVPVPTDDPGPQYAFDLNSCLTLIDQHDHSAGKGTPITPSGLNINSDLTFAQYNATNLRSVRFFPQASPLSGGADLGCLYESGVDLYYNDANGNQIRITASGSIVGTNGSIGNLVPPANLTYNTLSETFVFQSAVNTPANIDSASVIIRDLTTSSNGITLSAPSALAGNYSLTFPGSLPAQQSFFTIDSVGNLVGVGTCTSSAAVLPGTLTVAGATTLTGGITGGLSVTGAITGSSSISCSTTITAGTALVVTGGAQIYPAGTTYATNANNECFVLSSGGLAGGGFRIMRGYIAANGTIISGGEQTFSITNTGTGTYVIQYTTAFADIPAVVATVELGQGGGNSYIATTNPLVASGCQINTYDSATGIPANVAFSYIIIGQV